MFRLGNRLFGNADLVVMAIVNRTPDSFFDRGATFAEDAALRAVEVAVAEGADIIDIGGVKAGPGATVDIDEELRRTVPTVAAVRARFPEVVISIDTWRAPVAREAIAAGRLVAASAAGGQAPGAGRRPGLRRPRPRHRLLRLLPRRRNDHGHPPGGARVGAGQRRRGRARAAGGGSSGGGAPSQRAGPAAGALAPAMAAGRRAQRRLTRSPSRSAPSTVSSDRLDCSNSSERSSARIGTMIRAAIVTGPVERRAAIHAVEAGIARRHTGRRLKFTLPGPMTIVDTVADAHYGDRKALAMAFACLLNEEARELAALGVDVIQFDEPAFNVYLDEVLGDCIRAMRSVAGARVHLPLCLVPQRGGPGIHLVRRRAERRSSASGSCGSPLAGRSEHSACRGHRSSVSGSDGFLRSTARVVCRDFKKAARCVPTRADSERPDNPATRTPTSSYVQGCGP